MQIFEKFPTEEELSKFDNGKKYGGEKMKIGKYTAWFSGLMFLCLMACREIDRLSWMALPYMLVLAGAFRLLCKELEKEDDYGKRKKQNVPYDRQDLR